MCDESWTTHPLHASPLMPQSTSVHVSLQLTDRHLAGRHIAGMSCVWLISCLFHGWACCGTYQCRHRRSREHPAPRELQKLAWGRHSTELRAEP